MDKKTTKAPHVKVGPVKVLAFRVEAAMGKQIEDFAAEHGLSTADFLRAAVKKLVEPMKDRAEAEAVSLEALSPGARKKVARISAIRKELLELRAEEGKAGALEAVFEDGDGVELEGKIKGLEFELAALLKAVGKKLASSRGSAEDEFEALPVRPQTKNAAEVCYIITRAEGEDKIPCPKCKKPLVLEGLEVEPGESVELKCPSCGSKIEFSDADGEARREAADRARDEGTDGEEDGDEVEETDGEKKADLILEVKELLASLGEVREKRSFWDNLVDGGLPTVDLVKKALHIESNGGFSNGKALNDLLKKGRRVVEITRKLKALDGVNGVDDVKDGLGEELDGLRDGLAARKNEAQKKNRLPFPFDWL